MRVFFKSTTPEETQALGLRLGRILAGLDLVCLYGDLGSGKTTFTSGLARGMGCRARVMSPTFGLMRLYQGKKWNLHHLDLYRVGSKETGDIGIEDCLSDPQGVCVIEWPEAGLAYYPADRLEIRFSHERGGRGRRLSLRSLGPRSSFLLKEFKKGLRVGRAARRLICSHTA
ncbi:MAG: tRNA (adenosine(37)-N6)-threonylcarbamoyltransferase complex ATPase subunit type 1 TsaE [Elusimicrobia bacterium]|nr:tRNA (adenosine(37)-N6)-threonylcarbamoyltransferase complex ATPase subunit type 1 TsaE [Elusimicrobiota bacterium]